MPKLNQSQKESLKQTTQRYHERLLSGNSNCSRRAIAYLKDRGFGKAAVEQFQLGVVEDPAPEHRHMEGRICLPYLTETGPVGQKFRCTEDHECKEVGCPKYLYVAGSELGLFNARAVLRADEFLVVTEGEFDAVAVEAIAGIPAVGYPGVEAWEAKPYFRRVLDGIPRIVVVADGDAAGRKAAGLVAGSLDLAVAVHFPDGMDANTFLVEQGREAFRELIGLENE